MYIVAARLEAGPHEALGIFPCMLQETVTPADGIEHWHVELNQDSIDITFFIQRDTIVAVEAVAMNVLVRCMSNSEQPARWRLTKFAADIIGPVHDQDTDEGDAGVGQRR